VKMSELKLMHSGDGLLGVQEAAQFLGLKPSSVYKLVMLRKIPHYKLGKLVKFKRGEIETWLNQNCKVETRQSDYHAGV